MKLIIIIMASVMVLVIIRGSVIGPVMRSVMWLVVRSVMKISHGIGRFYFQRC